MPPIGRHMRDCDASARMSSSQNKLLKESKWCSFSMYCFKGLLLSALYKGC